MGGAAPAGSAELSAPGDDKNGPPRARLAFRVGIVGHRPNRLPTDPAQLAMLRRTLHTILDTVRETLRATSNELDAALYSGEQPLLRAISPLAEGSDRIFAEEALALGYALCCPMPFVQEEFEKDFAPPAALEVDSLAHFHKLLDQARSGAGLTKFEMDGERAQAPDAYGAAGRAVLNQTDLLVVIWDGGEPAGQGGTVHSLHEALRFHVPTIWINAHKPDAWHLLHTRSDLELALGPATETQPEHRPLSDAVAAIVRAEFRLPPHAPHEIASHAPDYFAERRPVHNYGFVWKMFRNRLADRKWTFPVISVADFEAQIRKEWSVASDGGEAPSPVADWINARLRVHFAWADGLADFYADAHRSAFISSYLLAALAVLTALLPLALGLGQNYFVEIASGLSELGILALILRLRYRAHRFHWRERWTDYRLLAELIRELRFLVPLGGGKPLPRIPAHLAVYGDPARTWMYWHVRAIAREIGIPEARVTPDYMRDCVNFLGRVVGDEQSGQRGFHIVSERRSRILGERLHLWVRELLLLTVVGVVLRLSLGPLSLATPVPIQLLNGVLLSASAVLPALGAALEGINNQGEFIRVAKRSAAMASGFAKYGTRIVALESGPPPRLSQVIPLSSTIADAMVAEVVDWRAVFIDRPLQ